MEIRDLNTFLKVADVQNFTQAGRELGYSQSNVSAQIKHLEQALGAPLFDRIGRRVCLTQYGESLLPYARQIVSTALQMEAFRKSPESLGGTVRFGLVESVFALLSEQTLMSFHKTYPRVQLELVVDSTEALKAYMRQGSLDAACVIDDPLPQAHWTYYYTALSPVVVVANPAHPLADKKNVRPEDLAGQDFVLMEDVASYSRRFQAALASRQVELRPFLKLQNTEMAHRLVRQGPYLSLLPLYTVSRSAETGHLTILNIPQLVQEQAVQIILHKDKVILPQLDGLLRHLRSSLSELLNPNP